MSVKMVASNFGDKVPPMEGREDGGENVLVCRNCCKELAKLWVTNPKTSMPVHYKASCPYCGDFSPMVFLSGGISYCGIYKDLGEDRELKITDVEHMEIREQEGYVLVHVKEAKKNER